jgi:hypothetical protein
MIGRPGATCAKKALMKQGINVAFGCTGCAGSKRVGVAAGGATVRSVEGETGKELPVSDGDEEKYVGGSIGSILSVGGVVVGSSGTASGSYLQFIGQRSSINISRGA